MFYMDQKENYSEQETVERNDSDAPEYEDDITDNDQIELSVAACKKAFFEKIALAGAIVIAAGAVAGIIALFKQRKQ